MPNIWDEIGVEQSPSVGVWDEIGVADLEPASPEGVYREPTPFTPEQPNSLKPQFASPYQGTVAEVMRSPWDVAEENKPTSPTKEQAWAAVQTPYIPIPKAPEVEQVPPTFPERVLAASNIAGQLVGPETWTAGERELYNQVVGMVEFMESPVGGVAAAGQALAPTATSAYFAYDLLKGAYAQARAAIGDWDNLSIPQKAQALIRTFAPAALGLGAGKHAVQSAVRGISAKLGTSKEQSIALDPTILGLRRLKENLSNIVGAPTGLRAKYQPVAPPPAPQVHNPPPAQQRPEEEPPVIVDVPTRGPGVGQPPGEPSAVAGPSAPVQEPTAPVGVAAPPEAPPSRTPNPVVAQSQPVVDEVGPVVRPELPQAPAPTSVVAYPSSADVGRTYSPNELQALTVKTSEIAKVKLREEKNGKWFYVLYDKDGKVIGYTDDTRFDAQVSEVERYAKPVEPPAAPAAQPQEPNAIRLKVSDAVSFRPAPGDSGTLDQGVRQAQQEPARAQAEAQAQGEEVATASSPQGEVRGTVEQPIEQTPSIEELRTLYDKRKRNLESFRYLLLRESKRESDYNTASSGREKNQAVEQSLRSPRVSSNTKDAYRAALRRFMEAERALEERLATEKLQQGTQRTQQEPIGETVPQQSQEGGVARGQETQGQVQGAEVAKPLTNEQKRQLRALGWSNEDFADLEAGNLSVPAIVNRRLQSFEGGGGPDHAAALEQARTQAVFDAERVLAGSPQGEVRGTVVPEFAARYDPETLLSRPTWVDPGSAFDKALGKTRESNDWLFGVDITPIWKSLSTAQRQELNARGWTTKGTRNPNQVLLTVTSDAIAAKKYYAVQAKRRFAELEQPQSQEGGVVRGQEAQGKVQVAPQPQPEPGPQPGTGMPSGPGAQTYGRPGYPAIRQLSDQLRQTAPPSLRSAIPRNERMADAWATGRSAGERALGKLLSVGRAIWNSATKLNNITDLERRLGELDYALQSSTAQSVKAKKLMLKQLPNQTMRDAVAIWVDTFGDPAAKVAAIRGALASIPPKTSPRVRRALAMAANMPKEALDFAQMVEQYYAIRLTDAVDADVMEAGLKDYYTHVWQKEENMPDALRGALTNGRVRTYFQYAQKRKIGTFLEGIMQGKTPNLDPAEVIPYYNYALDRAIASRKFVKELSDMTEADGRPTVAATGTSGRVEGEEGKPDAVYIRPQGKYQEFSDYERVNHPALRKWRWADTDPETGRQVFFQGDLNVHPAAYQRLRRIMDRGVLTPSPVTRGLLKAGSVPKSMMFGLMSTFHQVHVGMHAAFHWTNPVRAARTPIDWDAPETQFAVEKGHLKLAPDPGELAMFQEGLVMPELIKKVPIIGKWSQAYSEWLFSEFIPRLKMATFQNALQRARSEFTATGKALKSGKVTEEQLAARIGDSVNNAFGELNKLWLGKHGRHPSVQRFLQGTFLAPDFGEARLRFGAKALTKYGTEERLALATMFLTLYATARVANWLSHGDPETDWKNAFRVKVGDHWWSMRSVVGDVAHAASDFGHFMRVRLSPLYGATLYQILSGRDTRGQKRTILQTLGPDLAKRYMPIGASGFTRNDQKVWESFVGSMGMTAQRETPVQSINRMFYDWKDEQADPRLKAAAERARKETRAPSDYFDLLQALRNNEPKVARKEYVKLVDELGKKPGDISDHFNPRRKDGTIKPLIADKALQARFLATLNDVQIKNYYAALEERNELWRRFQSAVRQSD